MSRLRPNFASGKLVDTTPNVPITATQTALSSNQFNLLPAVVAPNTIELILDPLGLYCAPGAQERVLVTSYTAGSGVVTVTRGYLGTTAITHNNAGVSEDWVAAVSDQDFIHGNLTQLANDDHTQYQNTARHQAAGNHTAAPVLGDIFFPGFVIITARSPSNIPVGWLLCNGAAISRTTYANLFAAIGINYGGGDGSTTFNLPPAQGAVLGSSGVINSYSYGPSSTNADLLGQHDHGLTITSGLESADISKIHDHGFASGTSTGLITPGFSAVAGGTLNHEHDIGGVITAGPNYYNSHSHTTSGYTGTTVTQLPTTFFTVIIHI